MSVCFPNILTECDTHANLSEFQSMGKLHCTCLDEAHDLAGWDVFDAWPECHRLLYGL